MAKIEPSDITIKDLEREVEAIGAVGQDILEEDLTESATTTLDYSLEKSRGILEDDPVWQRQTPNSYSSPWGPSITTIEVAEIEPTLQYEKGSPAQVTAAAGHETDYKNLRIKDFLPSLFNADYVQRPATNKFKPAATDAKVTAVAADGYTTTGTTSANGWAITGDAEILIRARGFANPANNGLKVVTAITGTKLSVAGLVAESSPPANAYVALAGITTKGNTKSAYNNSTKTIKFGAGLDALNLVKHDWIQYIHNDVIIGWGRVESVTGNDIKLDRVAWARPADLADQGNSSIHVASRYINNPTAENFKRYSYAFERKIKDGQIQRVTGNVLNSLSLTLGTAAKLVTQLDFIALDGTSEATPAAGIRLGEHKETIYNTSNDIQHVVLLDPESKEVIGYLRDLSFAVDKGITAQFAIGRQGSVGSSSSGFAFTSEITAYFTDLGVVKAARGNISANMYVVAANESGAFVLDLPLVTVTTADVAVAKDEPVTVSISTRNVKGNDGYTLRWSQFEYAAI